MTDDDCGYEPLAGLAGAAKGVVWAALLTALIGLVLTGFQASTAAAQMPGDGLKPGGFIWMPELAPRGPLVVVISLPAQRAYVYRNGTRIGVSTVSTGKPGYDTPSGVYTILQKHREHYSNLYDEAPSRSCSGLPGMVSPCMLVDCPGIRHRTAA